MAFGELIPSPAYNVFYQFDDLTDSSGNGRTLTTSGASSIVNGKFLKGRSFGTSGNISQLRYQDSNIMSSNAPLNTTISFWIKFNSISNPSGSPSHIYDLVTALAFTGGNNNSRLFQRYSVSGGNFDINTVIKLSGGDAIVNYSIPVNTTNWYNFTIVKSSSTTLLFYVNGNLVGSNTGSGGEFTNQTSASYLTLGNRGTAGSSNQAWITISGFKIQERVWPAEEIKKMYTYGLGRFGTQN